MQSTSKISDGHVKAETKSMSLLTYSKGSGLRGRRGSEWHLSDNDDRIINFARQSPTKAHPLWELGGLAFYGISRGFAKHFLEMLYSPPC